MLKFSEHQNSYVVFIAVIAAIGGLLFGFDTGVISGAVLFIKDQFQLSAGTEGLVVSAVLFGAFLGAPLSGHISDIFGRRRLLIVTAFVFIFGTLLSAIAPDTFILIVGRFIVGMAIGVSSFSAPLYISETSPAKWRGMLVSFNQLFVTIGIVLSYFVDYIFAAA